MDRRRLFELTGGGETFFRSERTRFVIVNWLINFSWITDVYYVKEYVSDNQPMLWKLLLPLVMQLPGVQFESFLLNQCKIHLYVHWLDLIYHNLLFSSFHRGESSSHYLLFRNFNNNDSLFLTSLIVHFLALRSTAKLDVFLRLSNVECKNNFKVKFQKIITAPSRLFQYKTKVI